MFTVKNNKDHQLVIPTKEIELDSLTGLTNVHCKKILELLHAQPMYPKQIAKVLKIHEQNVYYYVKKLLEAKIIQVVRQEKLNGTMANYYGLVSPSFLFRIGEYSEGTKLQEKKSPFLVPFIEQGELNALIVVGSPDPHGPLKARSRDGYFGMDLALFLGTYLTHMTTSKVRLDTEVTDSELSENNLIILGGPIVNKVTDMVNAKMPIYFDDTKRGFYSTITDKTYFSDETGIICKLKSPFNAKKMILVVAGIRNPGTRSAMLAILKHFDLVEKGNSADPKFLCKVIEGVDLNSDGIVDDVEFLE